MSPSEARPRLLPLLQRLFKTGPVGAVWWAYLFAFVPVIFLAEEGRKMIGRRRTRRSPGTT